MKIIQIFLIFINIFFLTFQIFLNLVLNIRRKILSRILWTKRLMNILNFQNINFLTMSRLYMFQIFKAFFRSSINWNIFSSIQIYRFYDFICDRNKLSWIYLDWMGRIIWKFLFLFQNFSVFLRKEFDWNACVCLFSYLYF